ncbi:hypothetical protein BT96DRAFT_982179 [Gymnopus androsaceus JB14]|uniref:Uncharacterized protein n=1 Tax=Gymnopus androsaceus JB14 TaxID=1447944 RepID=A0A6A4GHW4_9AGAR|nr:hypothetical protein BT96DRAFT_982179 [Gymnopus androsaceus JB14]
MDQNLIVKRRTTVLCKCLRFCVRKRRRITEDGIMHAHSVDPVEPGHPPHSLDPLHPPYTNGALSPPASSSPAPPQPHSPSPPSPPPSPYNPPPPPPSQPRSPSPPSRDPDSMSDMRGQDSERVRDILDELPDDFVASIEDIRITNKFIDALKTASLVSDVELLDADFVENLRHPVEEEVTITNPDHRLSLDIFLAITTAAEQTYNSIRAAILCRHPESEILTFYKVKKLVTQLSGVTPIYRDMCVNSCMGFTGPFSDSEHCAHCGEARYKVLSEDTSVSTTKKRPRQQFCTIPIGPQIQALWRSPEGARSMNYRKECTERIMAKLRENDGVRLSPYSDFFNGSEYLEKVIQGDVGEGDVFLMLSIDGAQLYRYKTSNCWIYIWVILDRSPDV